ncbi:MAG: sensor histidine kinase [Candidatus Scatovivens sp.]
MNEEQLLKKQLFKHMKLSIITFAIILSLFGIFIFALISKMTYYSLDSELLEAAKLFQNTKIEVSNSFFEMQEYKQNIDIYNIFSSIRDYTLSKRNNNPRIICIIRDENLNVLNKSDLGKNYNNYLNEIDFDKDYLNKIYKLDISHQYNYRAINIKLDSSETEGIRYIQLMINADSENNLLKNYFAIIMYAVLFGILISIIASYLLSKSTLIPVAETIKKQTEFVENVSHELRTPLTIIQAKQELLLQEPNSKIIDNIEDIALTLEETKRLGKMTKDLMLLSRADSKRMEINKEEINIDEFLENLANSFREIIEMQNKKLELDLNYKSYIDIDSNKIYQVIVILLDNAIKYTEENDTIKIKTYLKDNKCTIEVSDTGIGISDEGINHIFDRFYREDKARNRETGGSGLGLSIANSIIRAHKGTIKAFHNNPKGSVFVIKIPR